MYYMYMYMYMQWQCVAWEGILLILKKKKKKNFNRVDKGWWIKQQWIMLYYDVN